MLCKFIRYAWCVRAPPLRLRDIEMGVVTEQFAVAACVRLQLQNIKDELRGTTQTCTVRSNDRSLRIGRAHDVTWCHMMSLAVTWCHLMSHDVTWCHMMSHTTFDFVISRGQSLHIFQPNSTVNLSNMHTVLQTQLCAWNMRQIFLAGGGRRGREEGEGGREGGWDWGYKGPGVCLLCTCCHEPNIVTVDPKISLLK